jgi:transcription antitermination factor NusG
VVSLPGRIPWFHVRDEVEIRDGPFEGIRGVVTRASGIDQVSVGIKLLGQGVAVTLAADGMLKLSA